MPSKVKVGLKTEPPAAGAVDLSVEVKIKDTKSDASGGEVSHLESG